MLSGSDVPAAPLSSEGEGRELHRAPPIGRPGCSGAPRLTLRVNKLYPEILSPPSHPRSVPHEFSFTSSFTICFLSPLAHHYHCPVLSILCPTTSPSPSCPGASENKLISLGLPTILLLYESARATRRSLGVHVPSAFSSSCTTATSQLCCFAFAVCFHVQVKKGVTEWMIRFTCRPLRSLSGLLCFGFSSSVTFHTFKQSELLFD